MQKNANILCIYNCGVLDISWGSTHIKVNYGLATPSE